MPTRACGAKHHGTALWPCLHTTATVPSVAHETDGKSRVLPRRARPGLEDGSLQHAATQRMLQLSVVCCNVVAWGTTAHPQRAWTLERADLATVPADDAESRLRMRRDPRAACRWSRTPERDGLQNLSAVSTAKGHSAGRQRARRFANAARRWRVRAGCPTVGPPP